MKFRMDGTLRFWVDCPYQDKKYEEANRTKADLIAEILRDYERHGDAMRYLNAEGTWKTSPRPCFGGWLIFNGMPRTSWRIGPDASGDGSKISSEMRA